MSAQKILLPTCSDYFHVLAQLSSSLVSSILREVIYVWGNGQGHAKHLPEDSTVTQRLSQSSQDCVAVLLIKLVWSGCEAPCRATCATDSME